MSAPYNPLRLSKRPFLVVETSYIPRSAVDTRKAGWGADPKNWERHERGTVVDRITEKHGGSTADVVIDLLEKKVLKSRNRTDLDQVFIDYTGKFADEIRHGVAAWINQQAEEAAKDLKIEVNSIELDADGQIVSEEVTHTSG